jgi:hypothetical protein
MTVLIAEVRNVDRRLRVGCQHDEAGARRMRLHPPRRLEPGQRAH